MDYTSLSKEMSYALRHAPWEYELEMDPEGWVPVDQLLESLRRDARWTGLDRADFERVVAISAKKRFELDGQRIRAYYGHSFPTKIVKQEDCPPPILFHGTARSAVDEIMRVGLTPQARQYVHLSTDLNTAKAVGQRKGSPVVLKVDAEAAYREGIRFYPGNDDVWLADHIPPQFIHESQ